MSFVKGENIRLKEKIQELEDKLVNLVGQIKIFSSGIVSSGKQHELNNTIANLLVKPKPGEEIKIVAPYIGDEYTTVLKARAAEGVKIQIVLNDRNLWPKEFVKFYDILKTTPKIDLVNNPNVKYLLIWTENEALFSSGPLDKNILMNTVLIGVLIKEKTKLNTLLEIYKEMLPSFLR